jgi:hypothetical protein
MSEIFTSKQNLQSSIGDLNWVKRIALPDAGSAEILAGIGGMLSGDVHFWIG